MSVRHSLDEWMKQNGLKNEGVCNLLIASGYEKTPSPRTIREIKRYRRCPGWSLCVALEKISKGAINARKFRERCEAEQRKKRAA